MRKYGGGAFPGRGRGENTDELGRLRRELERVKEEREILKKAALGSTSRRNTGPKFIRWGLKFQGLSRALIQT